MYEVTAQDLRSIERESLGVGQDLTFASIAASTAVTLLAALFLTTIDSRKVFDSFVATTIIALGFASYLFTSYSGNEEQLSQRSRRSGIDKSAHSATRSAKSYKAS